MRTDAVLATALPSNADPAVACWLLLGGAVVLLALGVWSLAAPASFQRFSTSTRSGAARTPSSIRGYGILMIVLAVFLGVGALVSFAAAAH